MKARKGKVSPLEPFFLPISFPCASAAPLLPVFSLSSCSLFLQAQSNLPLPFPQGNKGRNANDYSNPSCHRNAVMWLEQACIDHNKEVDQEPALERAVARLTGASVHFTQIQAFKNRRAAWNAGGEKQRKRHSKELGREAAMNLGCNTAVCHIFYHSLAYQGCVLFIMSFLEAELRRQ